MIILKHVHSHLLIYYDHLPVALGSMIMRMCFLDGFDDKKQEIKAQDYVSIWYYMII